MDEDISSIPDVPKKGIGISGKASSPASGSEPSISSAKSNTGSRNTCRKPEPSAANSTHAELHWLENSNQPKPSTKESTHTRYGAKLFPTFVVSNQATSRQFPDEYDRLPVHNNELFVVAKLRKARRGEKRFQFSKSRICELLERTFERNKMYQIRGRIDGIGPFKIHHFEGEKPHKRERLYLHAPREYAQKLKVGEKYRIAFDSVEERREFNAIASGRDGPTVSFRKKSIKCMKGWIKEKLRQSLNVIEFQIRNVSKPNQGIVRCFNTYRLGSDRLEFRLGKFGVTVGDVVRFELAKLYDLRDLVRDVNTHKSIYMANLKLRFEEKKLFVEVDGRRFELREPRLVTDGLQVVLTAELEIAKRQIKFWFDGEKVDARFIGNWPICSVEVSDYGLEIAYSQGRNRVHTFRLALVKFNRTALINRIKLVSVPQSDRKPYCYEVDEWLQEFVKFRFKAIVETGKWKYEKGDISEAIERYLLSMMPEWEEIANHPSDHGNREGSSRRGPDSLYRWKVSGELYYIEFKWHENLTEAYYDASESILQYLTKYPTYRGEDVKGGYVGILEWDVKTRNLNFYLERA